MIAVPFSPGNPHTNQVDQFLSERRWTIRAGAATVMTAEAVTVARDADAAPKPEGPGVTMAAEPGDDWLAMYHYRGQELPPVARRLLMSAPWQSFASVREAGETIAIGRVAAAGDWAGLTAVEVHPGHRRRGLATAVTTALAAQAAAHGVKGLYLQVENDNAAARALYHRTGFTDHHAYHYRVAPPP
jgi:ribosomal protein S18 acetylase RimI-like enzyme